MVTQVNALFDKYLLELYEDARKYYDFLDDLNTCDANHPEDSSEFTGPIIQKAIVLRHALEIELVKTNPDQILKFSEQCTAAYTDLYHEIEPESAENVVKSFQAFYSRCLTWFYKMNN
ncbi:hypothetical protein EPVG_00134 [Emiliania huxleyi virus 201]|nr:hypothetical protein ELVG_00169 [Emiliania huxleyi virus 203]AEP15863.1 hypothetical protein EQVG_00455 [Emiliania huxleyi virus 207]AEP16307.1 hypothetical protein ERVG_00434 [Emiliania huxleyi virus 208]AET98022.1 hypothetical protein EPVG_00134 [Emiliania huxleyi virus 201]